MTSTTTTAPIRWATWMKRHRGRVRRAKHERKSGSGAHIHGGFGYRRKRQASSSCRLRLSSTAAAASSRPEPSRCLRQPSPAWSAPIKPRQFAHWLSSGLLRYAPEGTAKPDHCQAMAKQIAVSHVPVKRIAMTNHLDQIRKALRILDRDIIRHGP